MLGTLLFLGVVAASGLKAAYDNYDMKKSSSHYDEKGNLHYYDRNLKDYINGERVQRKQMDTRDGVGLYSTVGVNSGKIYNTSYGRGTLQLLELSEEFKKTSIEYGRLSYWQFNPYFGTTVLTEIETGRTITCVGYYYNKKLGKKCYRIWYYNPIQGKCYDRTLEGDPGIPITEEEFKRYFIRPIHTIPSDHKILKALERGDYD